MSAELPSTAASATVFGQLETLSGQSRYNPFALRAAPRPGVEKRRTNRTGEIEIKITSQMSQRLP